MFAGVSGMKTDSISCPSSSRSRNFVVPSVERSCRTSSGVTMRNRSREAGAKLAPEVGHAREIGDAALVDPLEELPRVKTRMPHRLERLLELGELHFGEIVTVVGGHVRRRRTRIFYCIAQVQHSFSADPVRRGRAAQPCTRGRA